MIFPGLSSRLFPGATLAVLLISLFPQGVHADVITLKDGRTQQGILVRNHPAEAKVTIRTVAGEIAIPRDRIVRIQEESGGASAIRLGDQYLESGKVDKALELYRQAVDADPVTSPIATIRLQQAQQQLDARAQEEKLVTETNIDESLSKVEALLKQKEFDEASKILKSLGMGYGTNKAPAVRKAFADTYVAWAVDRLDRQDSVTAAEKLQFALRLDPTNQTARQLLIRAYEGDPSKLRDVADYFKESTNPPDQIRRADALFRLRQYEEALPIYLQYAFDPKFGSESVRDRIRLIFDTLHRQYADKGDYASALRWYQAFLQYSPGEDPSPATRYEYMIRSSQTNQQDPDARAALAEYAEQRGMVETAKREYQNVLAMAPQHAQALAGTRRFAQSDLDDAKAFFQQGQYALASAKTQVFATAYPMLPDLVKEAQDLKSRADVEQGRVAQTRLQQAVALADRGDKYFDQALSYISALISTNVDKTIRVISPRQEAIKYLGWAIFSWQYALQIDPGLGDPASYDLYRKISDASGKYATLANRVAPPLPRREFERSQATVRMDGTNHRQ